MCLSTTYYKSILLGNWLKFERNFPNIAVSQETLLSPKIPCRRLLWSVRKNYRWEKGGKPCLMQWQQITQLRKRDLGLEWLFRIMLIKASGLDQTFVLSTSSNHRLPAASRRRLVFCPVVLLHCAAAWFLQKTKTETELGVQVNFAMWQTLRPTEECTHPLGNQICERNESETGLGKGKNRPPCGADKVSPSPVGSSRAKIIHYRSPMMGRNY